MAQILIETILGGHAATTAFAQKTQMRASLGIDPAQPIDDLDTVFSTVASGVLRPAASQKFSSTTLTSAPFWFIPNPKDTNVYVYDAASSAYAIDAGMTTLTTLSDAGTLSGLGNGCEYYDNYMYFAKPTDITRYGPLNGVPGFVNNYWTGTLAKTALQNTTYPVTFKNKLQLPNHFLKRGPTGKLYIADVVGNNGTIHFIATSKTSVEGDTNNGSTYSLITLGYGLWPTALEVANGTDMAVAVYEGSATSNLRQTRAKVAFFNMTSPSSNGNPDKLIWYEFPDQIITAMKNVDGVLYVVSGNVNAQGFRISRHTGAYSFQEVYYSETGEPCLPGAIDGLLSRVLVGTFATVPEADGVLHSYGLQKSALGQGFFSPMRATGGTSSTSVTAVLVADNNEMGFMSPIIGWTQAGDGSTGVSHGIDKQGTQYNNAPSVFWSQMYRIGQKFKITKIRIPLAQGVAANMTLIPKFYVDDGITSYTLQTINNTNYPNSDRNIVIRPNGATGEHNFWLELRWTGSALLTVTLPISIEYEVIDD